ncbi:MAG: phosphoglycerate kinase [Alphaproteobacteria bacterium]|nr:phosphoglycerate kinase [Alphaproteobacteria bacterium]
MNKLKTLENVEMSDKTVILRVDYNVPMAINDIKTVKSYHRVEATIPTIEEIFKKSASKIVIISHMGRPEGIDKKYSLSIVVDNLSKLTGEKVEFIDPFTEVDGIVVFNLEETKAKIDGSDSKIILLENLRYSPLESSNDFEFSKKLSQLGEVYVNDGFAVSHRAHASVEGITHHMENTCAGFLIEKELSTIDHFLSKMEKESTVCLVGGSKVSTKIGLIKHFTILSSHILLGCAFSCPFIKRAGKSIGKSPYAPEEQMHLVEELLTSATTNKCEIMVAKDMYVTNVDNSIIQTLEHFEHFLRTSNDIEDHETINDLGDSTIQKYKEIISKASTVIWCGPVGWSDLPPFNNASNELAKHIAHCSKKNGLVSIAGGGDTASTLIETSTFNDFTFVSTAGGAFIEYIEGNSLPGIKAVSER